MLNNKLGRDVLFLITFLVLAMIIASFLVYKDFNLGQMQGALTSNSPSPKTISVNVSGANGRITSRPAGIDCGYNCSMKINSSLVKKVSLYAKPSTYSIKFVKWSGDCWGTRSTCTLRGIYRDKSATALFCSDECIASSKRCSSTDTMQACGKDGNNKCLIWKTIKCSGSTRCGYGKCSSKQKPQWYCANNSCTYTCYSSSSCR